MQQSNHSQLHTLCMSKLIQRLPSSLKQTIVNFSRLVESKFIEFTGQRKNNVVIRAGQQIPRSVFYPFLSFMPLTFWTMSIPTAVVTYTDIPAFIASINMTAQSTGSTIS